MADSSPLSMSTNEDNSAAENPIQGPGRGRGQQRRGRQSNPGRGRGRGSSRGSRTQRGGFTFQEGEEERLRALGEQRKQKADELIDRLDEKGAKEILKAIAEKLPSLVLDVAEKISRDDPDSEGEESTTWPSWCVCGRCREMPSDASRVCCGMRKDLCTSQIPEMELIITDPHVLFIQQLYRNDIFARHANTPEDINKSLRHASYRQFILFQYGRLGAHNRRPVPSCCTWFIRDKYPDPNGHYVDYVPSW